MVDLSQRLIGWNSRYVELMDYPTGMIHVGKPVAELIRYNVERGRFGSVNVETEVQKRLKYMRDGSGYKYQSAFFDGKVIEINGQPMPDGGFVTTYTDITDFKSAEAALVEAKGSLEQRVDDRTAELQQTMRALETAKGEAEEANVSKTRFVAAAAHDLLQPLNATKLFAALLKEHRGEISPELGSLVDRIESGLLAVEDLLSAILDISRLDTAAPQPRHEDFPINDLFAALHAQFSQTFQDKGLQLRFATTALHVRSDPALLRRILQNFVSNAHRYTRKGGVVVGCRRRCDDVIAIQVIDTGTGIADADRKAVFEEFRRLANSNSQSKRGLGLGLAIVDRIARVLGHTINLRSVPGSGSCFEVVVPRAAEPGEPQGAVAAQQQRSAASLDARPILCVDNDADILDGMRGLLSKWGADPLTAGTLEEAIVELMQLKDQQGRNPAMLLVDYHLDNGVTGIDVISALRDESGATLPAVILTADHTQGVADQVESAGHALLHKPIKPAALRALINRILARSGVA